MEQDELVGFWRNGIDDLSGLPQIWGFALEFLEGGDGINHNWGPNSKEDRRKEKINWRRTGAKTISVKFEWDDEWDDIEYEITVYDTNWFCLKEKSQEEFWCAPEPLYKKRRLVS